MAFRFVIELRDEDLEYFRRLFEERRRPGAGLQIGVEQVAEAAEHLIAEARSRNTPPFILEKLEQLHSLVEMITDREWQLPEPEVARVLDALAWFADPADLIPDDLPVLGYLDDALMVDIVVTNLEPELEAFQDFCQFRDAETQRRREAGEAQPEVSRADWLDARRLELHSRMRQRRRQP